MATAGTSTLREATKLFGPGYMAGQKKTALAGARQSMVGAGLSGTTRPGAVSAGMLAGFEDVRRSGLSTAMTNLAQMQSTEQARAEQLGLSRATLALERARMAQQAVVQKRQLEIASQRATTERARINPDWLRMHGLPTAGGQQDRFSSGYGGRHPDLRY